MTDQTADTLANVHGAMANAQHADQLVAQAAQRGQWMQRYRRPSQIAGPDEADMSKNLVGAVLILYSVEPGHSRRHNQRFTRWSYQTVDPDTGELLHEPARLVSFAQPVVRFADALNGSELSGLLVLNPPVVVRVAQEGDVILFRDP